jgi:hypothetical protein
MEMTSRRLASTISFRLAGLDHLDDVLQLVGPGLRQLLRPLDLLLCHPDQAVLDGGVPARRLLVEIAIAVFAIVVGERGEERIDRGRGRPPTVGPEGDLALRALDLLHELLQILTPGIEEGRLERQAAQRSEHLGLLALGLVLVLLPGRLGPSTSSTPVLGLDAAGIVQKLLALAQETVHVSQLANHGAAQLLFLFLGGFLFGVVHHILDGDKRTTQFVAEDVDLLDGERGRERGARRLVLALLDPLGQRDLALAREEGDLPHLAKVEPHRILGPADRARGQIDASIPRFVVVDLGRRLDLGGKADSLGRVHQLDVHGTEHQHDVVELIERDHVRRQGVVDLIVGEEALLLPLRDQLVQLLDSRFVRHA